ncbi:hypothetical protein ACN5LI_001836 [Cronobacter turicensis]
MLDATTIERQAWATASSWMLRAVEEIDEIFGAGFAKKNPGLVGDFMKTAALDQLGMNIRGAAEALERLEVTVHDGDK